MTDSINTSDGYFYWLCYVVSGDGPGKIGQVTASNEILLRTLNSIIFTWSIRMDQNRELDALELRKNWEIENDAIACTDDKHATVLEVLVALARRCEVANQNDICGDRTWVWFWAWIRNAGLLDLGFVETANRVYDILDHRYDKDGKGGFFYAPNSGRDLRKFDLWYQMQFWLSEQNSENPFTFE